MTRCGKWIVLLIAFAGCKKPYNPQAINAPNNYLVVEGVINSGSDSTFIKLSKSVNLSSTNTVNPVLNAAVTVEGDQNTTYPLTAAPNGMYVSAGLNLDNAHKYRLRIKTADNKEYLSDFVPVLNAPPIDTIGYTIQSNGINIYSNAHDPTNNVKYFRFDYTETWLFHTAFNSYFKSNGDTVLARDMIHDNIYQCWQSDTSSNIVLASTAKLSKNVLLNNSITNIASSSEKLEVRYSIMLKQYALTADAYTFWQNLKKNTEQLGSIFDAQPTEISGNIHSLSNPSEPVIGYLSVGAVAAKRVFIDNRQLPGWLTITPYDMCKDSVLLYKHYEGFQQVLVNQVNLWINYNTPGYHFDVLVPITSLVNSVGTIIGYTAAEPYCVDCTLRGTNKQPIFWK